MGKFSKVYPIAIVNEHIVPQRALNYRPGLTNMEGRWNWNSNKQEKNI